MNEYEVRLHDGKRISVYAYSRADLPTALEAEGFLRSDVAGVRLIEEVALQPFGEPFVTSEAYGYADAA